MAANPKDTTPVQGVPVHAINFAGSDATSHKGQAECDLHESASASASARDEKMDQKAVEATRQRLQAWVKENQVP